MTIYACEKCNSYSAVKGECQRCHNGQVVQVDPVVAVKAKEGISMCQGVSRKRKFKRMRQ